MPCGRCVRVRTAAFSRRRHPVSMIHPHIPACMHPHTPTQGHVACTSPTTCGDPFSAPLRPAAPTCNHFMHIRKWQLLLVWDWGWGWGWENNFDKLIMKDDAMYATHSASPRSPLLVELVHVNVLCDVGPVCMCVDFCLPHPSAVFDRFDLSLGSSMGMASNCTSSAPKHNKYCHFCQHVKVKTPSHPLHPIAHVCSPDRRRVIPSLLRLVLSCC